MRAGCGCDNDNGISRAADLDRADRAWLSFNWRRVDLDRNADYVTFDLSPDAGQTWVELDRFEGDPGAALIYTCAARHYVLGPQTHLEVDNSLEMLGTDLPTAGFYTFGEFAPGAQGGASVCMHNETFTVLLIGEAAA